MCDSDVLKIATSFTGANPVALGDLSGWIRRGAQEKNIKKESANICINMIHVVWQIPTQHCKSIFFPF